MKREFIKAYNEEQENIKRYYDFVKWEKNHPNKVPGFVPFTTIIDDIVIETSDCRLPEINIIGVGYNYAGVYTLIGLTQEAIDKMKEDREYIFGTDWANYDDEYKAAEAELNANGDEPVGFDCMEICGAKYKTLEEAKLGHERICEFIKKYGFNKFDDDDEDFVEAVLKGKSYEEFVVEVKP